MAAAYDDTHLVYGLPVEVLGERVDTDAEFACAEQFGVVLAGMHTKDDGVDVRGDVFGVPAHLRGQEPCIAEVGARGVKDFIVGTCDDVSLFAGYCDCQIVHGSTSDGDKMYSHNAIICCLPV